MPKRNTLTGIRSTILNSQNGPRSDYLSVEEPLEIRINGESLAVVLRTPGPNSSDDIDLALGFLATEGVIDDRDDVRAIDYCSDPKVVHRKNIIMVTLASGTYRQFERIRSARRSLFVGSSCGVCGKTSIENVFLKTPPLESLIRLPPELLTALPEKLRSFQANFNRTGGVHGAIAVNLDGQFVAGAEDIGRHNAVDKVVGYALRNDIYPLSKKILCVSSRAGFEIVQKAVMARFSAVVAIGAASSLADDLARKSNLALYSFVREGRYNFHGDSDP